MPSDLASRSIFQPDTSIIDCDSILLEQRGDRSPVSDYSRSRVSPSPTVKSPWAPHKLSDVEPSHKHEYVPAPARPPIKTPCAHTLVLTQPGDADTSCRECRLRRPSPGGGSERGPSRHLANGWDRRSARQRPQPANGHGAATSDRRMNANGLGPGAMTRSSTTCTSSDSLPWMSGLTPSQAHTPRTTTLSATTPSHEHHHHLMLPGAPPSALSSLYRAPLTLSELTRHPYQPIYTGAGASTPYQSLYTHAQPPGVSPLATPYGLYYQQQYASAHPAAAFSSDMQQQQTFSAMMARISQQAHQSLPRPTFHPYSGQTLTPPTGSPGPSSAPHQPTLHPSPILPPHAGSMYPRDSRERRRLPSSPGQTDSKPPLGGHRQSPAQGGHYPDLPPPSGAPRPSEHHHKESGSSSYSGSKSGADIDYSRQHSGPSSSAARRPLASSSSEAHSGFKTEDPSPKRPKVGLPPPLHPSQASCSLPPLPPLHPASYPSHPHYPPHFMKGSIIQLANGELRRVEDLKTEDFINSADISADLKIDSSTVVRIKKDEDRNTAILSFSVGEQRIQVTVEATVEHPFFVFGRGWSSCSPLRTLRHYGLQCSQLSVGDVCISLTQKGISSSLSVAPATSSLRTSSSSAAVGGEGRDSSGQISGSTEGRGPPTVRWTGLPERSDSEHSQLLLHHRHRPQSHLPGDTALPQQRSTPPSFGVATRTHQGEPASGSAGRVAKRRWSAPDQIHVGARSSASPHETVDVGGVSPRGGGQVGGLRGSPDTQRQLHSPGARGSASPGASTPAPPPPRPSDSAHS